MNPRRAFRAAVSLSLLLSGVPALAQPARAVAESPATTDGHYKYVFSDDLLAGQGFDANDVQIRVLRHPMRTTLIRPRTSFVPEMLASVEKL